MMRLLAIGLLALPLAACNGDHGSVQLSMNGADGDSNGASLSLDLPGVKGNLKLPKLDLKADDFKLNGVPLYPGSKIGKFDLDVSGKGDGDDAKGAVNLRFTSPASLEKVRTYFKDKLTKAGFELKDNGTGLTGKTDEGKPFTIDLSSDGADSTSGEIHMKG